MVISDIRTVASSVSGLPSDVGPVGLAGILKATGELPSSPIDIDTVIDPLTGATSSPLSPEAAAAALKTNALNETLKRVQNAMKIPHPALPTIPGIPDSADILSSFGGGFAAIPKAMSAISKFTTALGQITEIAAVASPAGLAAGALGKISAGALSIPEVDGLISDAQNIELASTASGVVTNPSGVVRNAITTPTSAAGAIQVPDKLHPSSKKTAELLSDLNKRVNLIGPIGPDG